MRSRWQSAALVVPCALVAACVGSTGSGGASVTSPSAAATAWFEPVPSVAADSASTWKTIAWTRLSTTPDFGGPASAAREPFQVFGWSRGYVAFSMTDAGWGSSHSADGIHWLAGGELGLKGAGLGMLEQIRSVIEGPGGLLAVGWASSCGSEFLDSLWLSQDGITWQPVDASKVFGADPAIARVSGGAAGYVAVAFRGAGAWTSKDGRTWRRVDTTAGVFASSVIDDASTVADTFVLAGTTGTPDCAGFRSPRAGYLAAPRASVAVEAARWPVSGASDAPALSARTASAWRSSDGSSWIRVTLPGAVASADPQWIWTAHLGDRAMLIVDGTHGLAWGSHDGQTWSPVGFPDGVDPVDVISADGRNLVVHVAIPDVASGESPTPELLQLKVFNDSFNLLPLSQSGDVPQLVFPADMVPLEFGLVAVGPTGVVVANGDGSCTWFGAPSE
jgi:hypothetical protein